MFEQFKYDGELVEVIVKLVEEEMFIYMWG